jgi:hypothetical protein
MLKHDHKASLRPRLTTGPRTIAKPRAARAESFGLLQSIIAGCGDHNTGFLAYKARQQELIIVG